MMKKFIYKISIVLAFVVLIPAISGCGKIKEAKEAAKEIVSELDKTVEKAIEAIDDASLKLADAADGIGNDIDAASSNINRILNEMDDKIIGEAREMIDTDLTELVSNSIALAGVEFRCNIDFVINRIQRKLQQLKAKLLGGELDPVEPSLCQVIPPMIDMSVSANERNRIIFTGYDLQRSDKLKVYLVQSNGIAIDYASMYSASTTYQGILNMGANGIPVSPISKKIELRYDERVLSEVPIIQSHPDICERSTVTESINPFACRPTTYLFPDSFKDFFDDYNYNTSKLCKEDWAGNPRIKVFVKLIVSQDKVIAQTFMQISGSKIAKVNVGFMNIPVVLPVSASQTTNTTIYTAPSDKKIVDVKVPRQEFFEYEDTDTGDDEMVGSEGLVQRIIVTGKRPKGTCDVGGETNVTVRLNNLDIELLQKGNCVDETTVVNYLEMYPALRQTVNMERVLNSNARIRERIRPIR